MKDIIIGIFLLLVSCPLYSQTLNFESDKETYALIIGISDYADDSIPDLRFAHRDAQIFNDFLCSPAGGSVPKENIRLLLNKDAKIGNIDNALNWLGGKGKEGTRFLLYFSCHGDVEKQTLWQKGYLLAHDTPYNNYRNNAVRLEDLNELVLTLSVGQSAEVVLITDACRSGSLAGNGNRGSSLTTEQLEQQEANEVRIVSCKSNQKSYEGEQWGGGRGVFSYHFVNGLIGLADESGDQDFSITKEEIERYLKKMFRKENKILEKRQNPKFTGDEVFKLAQVHEPTLTSLTTELNLQSAMNNSSEAVAGILNNKDGNSDSFSKGLEVKPNSYSLDEFVNLILEDKERGEEKAENLFQNMIPPLDASLQSQLLSATQNPNSLEDTKISDRFFNLLADATFVSKLPQSFKNDLAVSLHNYAQKTINAYLKGDARELEKRYMVTWAEEKYNVPQILQLAGNLLEKDHFLHPKVAVKYHYFAGVVKRLAAVSSVDRASLLQEALDQVNLALKLDDKAPYVHNELGIIYKAQWILSTDKSPEKDALLNQSIAHLEKAMDLAPTWSFPIANLAGIYLQLKDLEKAKSLANKTLDLQEDYYATYLYLGQIEQYDGNLLSAETYYRKAEEVAPKQYQPYNQLGNLYLKLGKYGLADFYFKKVDERLYGKPFLSIIDSGSDGGPNIIDAAGNTYELYSMADSIDILLDRIKSDSADVDAHYLLGSLYDELNQDTLAEKQYRIVLQLEDNFLDVYNKLGTLYFQQNRLEETEVMYEKMMKQHPDSMALLFKFSTLYHNWKRYDSEEAIYRKIINHGQDKSTVFRKAYEKLFGLLEQLNRFEETETTIIAYQNLFPNEGIYVDEENFSSEIRTSELWAFYQRMVSRLPDNVNWVYKKALHEYQNNHLHLETLTGFEKTLKLDTTIAAKAAIYQKIGLIYNFFGNNAEATAAYEKAHALSPDLVDYQFELVDLYIPVFRHYAAFDILKNLEQDKRLNFENRLRLVDYYFRNNQQESAFALLKKAVEIQVVPHLKTEEMYGNFYMTLGEKEASITRLKKVIELNPDNYLAYYSIASQYAIDGKTKAALDYLEQALDKGFLYAYVLKYDPDWSSLRENEVFKELEGRLN